MRKFKKGEVLLFLRKMARIKLVFFILAVLFLIGCASQTKDSDISSSVNDDTAQEQGGDSAAGELSELPEEQESNLKEFTITAKRFEFNPSTISVNEGDKVRLKITSLDVTHGFSLPSFNINKDLKPGEEVIIEFTADKVGTFTFACSVVCGSGHGSMNGKLIVK